MTDTERAEITQPLMPRVIDLTGRVFGRLTVLGIKDQNASGSYRWLCRCECGGLSATTASNLKDAKTTSCGCAQKEAVSKALATHGMSRTSEHNIWCSMIQRCTNPNNNSYHNYGGRGISVCSDWLSSFETFHRDMGNRPSQKYSIDRIDNERGYSKQNCRWATCAEQSANSRRARLITYEGVTLLLRQWAEKIGIHHSALQYRLKHWPLEKALTKKKTVLREVK